MRSHRLRAGRGTDAGLAAFAVDTPRSTRSHTRPIEQWLHDHTFGQDQKKSGERRTVIAITGVTMVAEIAAGVALGSMAFLADSLHMGARASALAVVAFAYHSTRRHA